MRKLEEYVESIPDFSEPGIIFRDAINILWDADGFHMVVDSLIGVVKDLDYDLAIGSEPGGFIFGVPVAYVQHRGFVPVRERGKLPCETTSMEYNLEYGQTTIEMHKDTIRLGQKVIIVDDLVATGGTTETVVKLIEQLGGQVIKIYFVVKLAELKEREHLKGYDVDPVIIYKGK